MRFSILSLVNWPKAHWENSDSGRKEINSFGLGTGFITANLDSLTNYFWNPVFFETVCSLRGKISSWFAWACCHRGELAVLCEQDSWWLSEVPHVISFLGDWETNTEPLERLRETKAESWEKSWFHMNWKLVVMKKMRKFRRYQEVP